MTTPIKDYVCNLISGRDPITNLYYAVDRARIQKSKCLQYCYKVSFKGIGSRMYKGYELVNIDDKALSNCAITVSNPITLDQYILLLLKARSTIQNLYQTRMNAFYIHSSTKIFCYTFINPFGQLANVNTDKITFKSSNEFLSFYNACYQCKTFNPSLVINQ